MRKRKMLLCSKELAENWNKMMLESVKVTETLKGNLVIGIKTQ